MDKTWVLVANSVRARLFASAPDHRSLSEIGDFINPEGRKPAQDYAHERLPRTMESVGKARHAIEPHTSAEAKVADRFARELNDMLERGRVGHQYERLVIAAPPQFLGSLQKALDKQVRSCVVAHLDKDLTAMPAEKIGAYFKPPLAS
jgi:protein required for attachment to host cells